ncbi:MAG: type III-A CRISPR-associated protein Csm2 [Saprospiraceae bacterium]|nr:MAG: type III-A CRISPR-associated protein Csm2 [Saprospiraceae bacterium]
MNGKYNNPGDRRGGGNRNFGGDRNKGGGDRQISPEEFVKGAQDHFGKHYADLLDMEHSADLDGLDKQLKAFVKLHYKDVTSSQLRNIFGKIKPIEKKEVNKLKMQRPKLAYVIARQNKKQGALALMYWFDDLIGRVKGEKDVEGFKTLLEAVVAYHKYFETLNPKQR